MREDTTVLEGTFGLVVRWGPGPAHLQHLSCYTRAERDSWLVALQSASHGNMRQLLLSLRDRVNSLANTESEVEADEPTTDCTVIDPSTPPLLECSFSCDNLLCDALGRSPSARLLIYLRNSTNGEWRLYANTEIVEVRCLGWLWVVEVRTVLLQRTSNPSFLLTVTFRCQHNINRKTQVSLSLS